MLLVTDLERGGTPLRIARLARGLRAAGVAVHAGCLAPPGPVSELLEAAGVPTFACHAESARDLLALKRLSDLVREMEPDLIHATLMHANVAARIVGALRRVPVVASTATVEVERPWHRALERATAGVERAHIVNSRTVAEHVVASFGLDRRRVHIVPPSLDPPPRRVARAEARAALGIVEDEFVVAWAGRLDPVKRLGVLVDVAGLMRDRPARFLVIGDGPLRSQLERTIERSDAADHVRLLGWHAEVGPVLSAADAFLFPSLTEGMPNAVLEAMCCGLAIVASDIPVLRELSDDGRRFVLVAGDRPRDFAAALSRLRDDERTRRELGGRAADWAQRTLAPEATIRAVLDVYQRVLGR